MKHTSRLRQNPSALMLWSSSLKYKWTFGHYLQSTFHSEGRQNRHVVPNLGSRDDGDSDRQKAVLHHLFLCESAWRGSSAAVFVSSDVDVTDQTAESNHLHLSADLVCICAWVTAWSEEVAMTLDVSSTWRARSHSTQNSELWYSYSVNDEWLTAMLLLHFSLPFDSFNF